MSHPLIQEPDYNGGPISDRERRFRRISYLLLGLAFLSVPMVLAVRSSLMEPFRIPSSAMEPTLLIGDHILAQKWAYGWRIPFTRLPITEIRAPDRGDVVVFVYPGSDERKSLAWLDLPFQPIASLDYIKRVIGLPGDTIEVKDNVLYINQAAQGQSPVGDYEFVDDRCQSYTTRHATEDLSGHPHAILMASSFGMRMGDFPPTTVPQGHFFVMGDNRDHSADSRIWGFVPIENVKGKAVRIWLSMDYCQNMARTGRIWQPVQ